MLVLILHYIYNVCSVSVFFLFLWLDVSRRSYWLANDNEKNYTCFQKSKCTQYIQYF